MTGHPTRPLTDIRAVAVTATGERFATGADDGSIRLWSTHPFRRLDAVSAHEGGTLALALDESRGALVSTGANGRVLTWRLADDRLEGTGELTGLRGYRPVRGLAVSAYRVAGVSDDRSLRVCRHDGTGTFSADTGLEPRTVAFLPGGDQVVLAGTRGHAGIAQIWRVDGAPEVLAEVEVPGCETVRCAAVAGRQLVLLGGDGGTVVAWDLAKWTLKSFRTGQPDVVHALAVREGGDEFVAGGSDGVLRQWNIHSGLSKQLREIHDSGILAVAIAAAAAPPIMVVAGGDGALARYRDEHKLAAQFSGHRGAVRAIAVSAEDDLVATGGADHTVRLWNRSGDFEAELVEHRDTVTAIATWPKDRTQLVSGGEDGLIIVWDRVGKVPVGKTPMDHEAKVWAVAVDPTGRRIYSGGNDGKVIAWNAETHKRIGQPWVVADKAVSAIALSGDGTCAVFGSDDGRITFRDLHRHNLPAKTAVAAEGGQIHSVALDGDGRTAVAGSDSGVITVWNVPEMDQVCPPIETGHGDVRKLLLSPWDGSIISCGEDGSVERWDRRTGKSLGNVYPDFVDAVETIGLMPDGEVIVAGGGDGALELVSTAAPEQPATVEAGPPGWSRPPHPLVAGDSATAHDQIGTDDDVRSIAELLAAQQTRAPLSIALLGEWGSGKSSLILQTEDLVQRLADSARDEPSPFWMREIRQVRFNAWHYSDDHLWTGLIERLLDALRDPPATGNKAELRTERDHLLRQRKELEKHLTAADEARTSVFLPLAWAHLVRALFSTARSGADDPKAGKAHRKSLSGWTELGRLLGTCSALFIALMVTCAFVFPDVRGWVGSAVSLAAAVIAGFLKAGKRTGELADILTRRAKELDDKVGRNTAELKRADPEFLFTELREELSQPNRYERYRGLTGYVHQDLSRLAEALDKVVKAENQAGIERIVLYVDDLDRCPPARVVEVLQAVNLLMTFEIFVVVVAVDPPAVFEALRCVRTAAVDERRQRTLDLGLLDKVFNLAFAVQPLGRRGDEYLRHLLDDLEPAKGEPLETVAAAPARPPGRSPAAAAPPAAGLRSLSARDLGQTPPHLPRISQDELDLLASLTAILPGPRAVKKLTNIYRLILAGEFGHREEFLREDFQAAAVLSAGLVRSPEQFASLIRHLSTVRPCPDEGEHRDVVAVFRRCSNGCAELAGVLAAEINRLRLENRCPERYRAWSVKIARYGFATYQHYAAG
ncbi:P-loop NTPase fold protein [Amycolatopsis vancoresmycina]|uniref:Peptidase C14 n=1 Tax=Amycolatopsis vancoresmycina DSM 44592 TaxID=1292037 RepID=R1FY71_9PSEU|nr:P-loop NTPase fold protein [Amycolatopsis vancoresmycina]EOD64303.1 peptidase C14 [Amycolatopsis vancoresmycina DSM 44592]